MVVVVVVVAAAAAAAEVVVVWCCDGSSSGQGCVSIVPGRRGTVVVMAGVMPVAVAPPSQLFFSRTGQHTYRRQESVVVPNGCLL